MREADSFFYYRLLGDSTLKAVFLLFSTLALQSPESSNTAPQSQEPLQSVNPDCWGHTY